MNISVSESIEIHTVKRIKDNQGKRWYKNHKLHRDNDLPAVILADGTMRWYKNDKLHRDNDLPAKILADGTMGWYKNHKLHRDNDLPAEIYADGTRRWYKNGVQYIPIRNDLQNIICADVLAKKYGEHICSELNSTINHFHIDAFILAMEYVDATNDELNKLIPQVIKKIGNQYLANPIDLLHNMLKRLQSLMNSRL